MSSYLVAVPEAVAAASAYLSSGFTAWRAPAVPRASQVRSLPARQAATSASPAQEAMAAAGSP